MTTTDCTPTELDATPTVQEFRGPWADLGDTFYHMTELTPDGQSEFERLAFPIPKPSTTPTTPSPPSTNWIASGICCSTRRGCSRRLKLVRESGDVPAPLAAAIDQLVESIG